MSSLKKLIAENQRLHNIRPLLVRLNNKSIRSEEDNKTENGKQTKNKKPSKANNKLNKNKTKFNN